MEGDTNAKTVEIQVKVLMEAMDAKGRTFPTPTGLQHYKPRPTDTIISTYMKSGTTLLQNLAYHLAYLTTIAPDSTTPATDTFTDICVISPYVDYIPEFGIDFPKTDPRILKTHSPFRYFARFHDDQTAAPRHIVVIRSPFDFAPSYLDFLFDDLVGHAQVAKARAVREAFFHEFVRRRVTSPHATPIHEPWFEFVRDWTAPLRANVLVLFYEDVVRDLEATTRAVASFMRLDMARVTDEVVEKVAAACDRGAMASDPRFRMGVEARGFGLGTKWKALPEKREHSFKAFAYTDEEIERIRKRFENVLGFSSYEEFKEATKKAQKDMFGR